MIKNFKMFEKASKDLAPYQKLNPKQAQEFVKVLSKNLQWESMSAADLADLEKKTGMKAGEIINLHFTVDQDPGAIDAFKKSYAKANGAKDWPHAIRAVKESDRFKSDEDIAAEFDGFTVSEFKMPGGFSNKMMGHVVLDFPNGDEHVGGGASQTTEDFLYNEETGEFKIAFDNWYPENVGLQIISEVKKRIQEASGKPVKQIRFGEEWGSNNESHTFEEAAKRIESAKSHDELYKIMADIDSDDFEDDEFEELHDKLANRRDQLDVAEEESE